MKICYKHTTPPKRFAHSCGHHQAGALHRDITIFLSLGERES